MIMSINQVSKPKKKKERAFGSPENLKDTLALGLACMHICKCHQKSTPFHLSGVLVFCFALFTILVTFWDRLPLCVSTTNSNLHSSRLKSTAFLEVLVLILTGPE